MSGRRNLKWDEVIAGEKYRVWKKPEHLTGIVYPYIGAVGQCLWSDKNHGVNMIFPDLNPRIIPLDCIEEVETTDKMPLTADKIQIGKPYRIISAPNFWSEAPELFSLLGRIGILKHLTRSPNDPDALAILEIKGVQRCVSLKNLEAVDVIIPPAPVQDLSDDILIDKILQNPKGFLKIIKGLAKMNKEPRLKCFLERGTVK